MRGQARQPFALEADQFDVPDSRLGVLADRDGMLSRREPLGDRDRVGFAGGLHTERFAVIDNDFQKILRLSPQHFVVEDHGAGGTFEFCLDINAARPEPGQLRVRKIDPPRVLDQRIVRFDQVNGGLFPTLGEPKSGNYENRREYERKKKR